MCCIGQNVRYFTNIWWCIESGINIPLYEIEQCSLPSLFIYNYTFSHVMYGCFCFTFYAFCNYIWTYFKCLKIIWIIFRNVLSWNYSITKSPVNIGGYIISGSFISKVYFPSTTLQKSIPCGRHILNEFQMFVGSSESMQL